MEFSGLFFLYLVLPLILLAYFLIPDVSRRNTLLIAASLLLYGFCQPLYVFMLLWLCRVNFTLAQKLKKGHIDTLLLPLACDFGVLILLKYADPLLSLAGIGSSGSGILRGFVTKVVQLLNGYGLTLEFPKTLAPLGISFFTLSAVSYLLDIYRGKHPAERQFKSFLLHMVMFPKLFQGPLVRYEQTVPELKERRENYRSVFEGAVRCSTGLGKKVLLADYCGAMIAELVQAKSDQALTGSWLIAVLFFFRIYYDFSGCCDMAVGLGRILGFRFPENFNLPYTAMSVTDFCQRWNLTLVSFFRDYIYDPLYKKYSGSVGRFIALLTACLLGGLWHGAGFNFAVWGLYLLVAILVEKLFEDFLLDLPYLLRHVLTVLALLLGWVIFRSPDMESLAGTLKAMIGDGGLDVPGDAARLKSCIPLIAVCWFGVTSLPRKLRYRWRQTCGIGVSRERGPKPLWLQYVYVASCVAYVALIFWWCTVSRTAAAVQPSIFMNL